MKRNLAILLAFILPVAFIATIALSVYLPSLLLRTEYDFVYALCSDSSDYDSVGCGRYLQKLYAVVDNKLVINAIDPTQDSDHDGIPDLNENYTIHFFLHGTKNNESREISLTEVKNLTLSGLLTSPDGVTVSSGYDRNGIFVFPFIFDGGFSSYDYYLTKGKSQRKLNLIKVGGRSYYYGSGNFRFIGWVLSDRN